MIYLSTGLLKKNSTSDLIDTLDQLKIYNLELSSGPFEKNIDNFLIKKEKEKEKNYLIHNYFPVPKKPFVLNLASNKKTIRNQSMKLAKNAIRLSSKIGGKFYSIHAGFLIDPSVKSLGKKIKEKLKIIPRDVARKNFINSMKELSLFAKKYKVKLLIENNVLTQKNYSRFKGNPFLFVDYAEINNIMPLLPKNVGLLLDVGHLNVSSRTLKFDRARFIKETNKWINGYQLSENNGIDDQNRKVKLKSWFFKYLKKNKFYSLEIKLEDFNQFKNQVKIVKKYV